MNRPVRLLMDKNPLVVDYDTPLEHVSKSALSRVEDNIYDYIIITKEGRYFGTATIKRLLEKTTQLELNRAKHANPLTGLPGNVIIENELNSIINEQGNYAVLYFDLDNFKAYNDVYGFENGDKILNFTAQVIRQHLAEIDNAKVFLWHIGGDDFVAIVRDADVVRLCEQIIMSFDSGVSRFYSDSDQQRGYIISKNRHGIEEKYPLITISIAVVTNNQAGFNSAKEIGEKAGLIKKRCKLTWQSCYIID